MKPPYEISAKILALVNSISVSLGEIKGIQLVRPPLELRKYNRIKSVWSSCGIEGNTLTLDQVSAILSGRAVIGPKKDVTEIVNAIKAYDELPGYDASSADSFLKAHGLLMKGLMEKPGRYRSAQVGVFDGTRVIHLAPPATMVPELMSNLFEYLKRDSDIILIKSCVFHYEAEFIHPFMDGNGRMGRLWQTVILMREYPVFEFLPFENLIRQRQQEYYQVLASCGQTGQSTLFIEFMLEILDKSLEEMLDFNGRVVNDSARLEYFTASGRTEFTRKDYMDVFKTISSATASRDLRKGVGAKLFEREGDKNKTVYRIV